MPARPRINTSINYVKETLTRNAHL